MLGWAKKVEDLGAGEIMLTSIDMEGTKKGFDLELNKSIADLVSIPIIAIGGAGSKEDVTSLLSFANVDAVAIASLFHYNILADDLRMDNSLIKEFKHKRRQDLRETFRVNGAIYLVKTSFFEESKDFCGVNSYAYVMDKEHSVDIDSNFDLKLAEFLMQK